MAAFVLLSLCMLRVPGGSIAAGLTQAPSSHQSSVDAYREALRTLETHAKGRHDLEALFDAVAPVREGLLRVSDGTRPVLVSLTDDEYRRVQDELTGVLVNREESVFVEPDPDFFVQLAVGHGDTADRRFFAALKATYPESVWPVYVDQQTDIGGCTRFGSGKLVATYRLWSDFRQRFPARYRTATRRESERVAEALTRSDCACADAPAVERELQQFVRAFPGSSIRAAVDRRLQAARSGQLEIRLRCTPG